MADDRDFEPTEPASQRRLDEARAQGQVARSAELSTFVVLFAAALSITLLGTSLAQAFREVFAQAMVLDRATIFAPSAIATTFASVALNMLFAFLPLLLTVMAVTVGSAFLLGGWTFAPSALAIDVNRINPFAGAQRVFSLESLLRFFKHLFKAVSFGAAMIAVVWLEAEALPALLTDTATGSASALARWLGLSGLLMVGLLGVVATIDTVFAIWIHRRGLRMTRAQLSQEYRDSEGAPEFKSRLRARQRAVGRARRVSAQETL